MPTVPVSRDYFHQLLGRSYTQRQFEDVCFEFGIELDDVTSEKEMFLKEKGKAAAAAAAAANGNNADNSNNNNNKAAASAAAAAAAAAAANLSEEVIYKIDTPANRYDLLSAEGLANALKVFLGLVPAPPAYRVLHKQSPLFTMCVDRSVRHVRDYVVCAVLKNIKFNERSYKSFIDLQERLHLGLARRRTLASVGTHDLDKIYPLAFSSGSSKNNNNSGSGDSWNIDPAQPLLFRYKAIPKQDIAFIPLRQTTLMDCAGDGLEKYFEDDRHIRKYCGIISSLPNYPIILDDPETFAKYNDKNNNNNNKHVDAADGSATATAAAATATTTATTSNNNKDNNSNAPRLVHGSHVLSLPPVINSAHSAISVDTRNILIECTAPDHYKAQVLVNQILAAFSGYCDEPFTAEAVRVVYETDNNSTNAAPDGTTEEICPVGFDSQEATRENITVSLEKVNSLVGINLPSAQAMADLLKRMLFDIVEVHEASSNNSNNKKSVDQLSGEEKERRLRKAASGEIDREADAYVTVAVPATRPDVIGASDIIEDVAIAYGYDNMRYVECATHGAVTQTPVSKLGHLLRLEMAAAGYVELLTYSLCSRADAFSHLRRVDTDVAVHLMNPKTVEFQVARPSLLPGLLKSLSHNKSAPLPQRYFECADVVMIDNESNFPPELVLPREREYPSPGARNSRRLAAIHCESQSSAFENIHAITEYALRKLGLVRLASAIPGLCNYTINNNNNKKFQSGCNHITAATIADASNSEREREAAIFEYFKNKVDAARDTTDGYVLERAVMDSEEAIAAAADNNNNSSLRYNESNTYFPGRAMDIVLYRPVYETLPPPGGVLSAEEKQRRQRKGECLPPAPLRLRAVARVKIGALGVVHPAVLKAYDIPFPCSATEINVQFLTTDL